MKFFGYAIAVVLGWFAWQFVFAIAAGRQSNHGTGAAEITMGFLALPIGMGVASFVSWIWFKAIPDSEGGDASSNAQTAGLLACCAAVVSCGWIAASPQQNPPEVLFFPLAGNSSHR